MKFQWRANLVVKVLSDLPHIGKEIQKFNSADFADPGWIPFAYRILSQGLCCLSLIILLPCYVPADAARGVPCEHSSRRASR